MAYTPVSQRNQGGAGIQPKSVGGYTPVSNREPASPSGPVSNSLQNSVNASVGEYIPVEKRPKDFAPVSAPAPAPAAPQKPIKQGFISKVSSKIGGALDRPTEKELGTNARKNTLKYLPSAIVESLPFGLGQIFKQIHDEEEAVAENPEYAPYSPLTNFDNKDLIRNLPKATIETAKGFVKAPISGAVNVYDAVTNKKTKFNIPGLGEVSSAQARTAERVADGEDPVAVALEEGATSILDTLFFASLAMKPFQGRPVVTAKSKLPAETFEKVPGASKAMQPKSFRLYEPKTSASPLSPEFIERAKGQGVNFGPNFKPERPTYFRMSYEPKTNSFKGEIVQIKPSWVSVIKQKFGGDITKAPPQALDVISAPKEVKVKDIEAAVKKPVVEQKPAETSIAPTPEVKAPETAILPQETAPKYVPVEERIAKSEEPAPAIEEKPAISSSSKMSKQDMEYMRKVLIRDGIENPTDEEVIKYVNSPIPYTVNPDKLKGATAKPKKIMLDLKRVRKLEDELKTAYKTYPEAEGKLNEILSKLELAEAGKRIFDHSGPGVEVSGVPSTFPAWIPENLRTKKSLDALLEVIKGIETITYPTRPNATARRLLVNEMLSVLDEGLGIDTSGIRDDIMQSYGHETRKIEGSDTGRARGSERRGGATAKRGEIEAAKKKETEEQITRLKQEISEREDFGGKLSDEQVAERKAELEKLEGKTQKEKVADSVKESPKSIKEIAEETKIKEPNIRRILGVGAKEGIFERVEKGVYVLSKNGEDLAFVETGDALESLPRLAGEGFKADMVFLDIPYDTPAVKGGNRGVDYKLLSVSDFGKILDATGKIVRDEKAPIIHMFSQAPSGMKAMEKYNDLFIQKGWKPVGRGEYQKTFADGSPVTSPNGKVAQPEGILVFTKSGELQKDLKNLNFTLKRPKGYQTEKPAEMLKAMIEMTTEEGDMVLDPFAGSGVTGAEAVRAGRKSYSIEKDADVAEKITKPRVKEAIEEAPKRSKRIGMMDYHPSYTPRMNELIKEAQEKDEMFPYTKMTKEEQAILDKAWRDVLSKIPMKEKPAYKGGSEGADVGVFADGTPVELGSMDKVRPVEFPELVDIARDLMGNVPFIKKLKDQKGGYFRHLKGQEGVTGSESIVLNSNAFKDPEQAAKILAHELGHLIDFLPEGTLARGNLIGRLKTLREFMGETFGKEKTLMGEREGKFSDSRRQQIKNKITREVLQARGLKFGDLFGNKLSKEERSSLNKEISEKTREAVNELLDKEGFIRNKIVQKELMEVTKYWRPYDPETSSESYNRYRKSSKELYADALSMLFNTPGTLEKMAPTFYKEFFEALDRKPEVFNAYFELQDLLGGDRDVLLERRRGGVRGMFDKGDLLAADIQRTRLKIAEEKRRDFAFQFKYKFVDKNQALIDRINKVKKEGKFLSDDENPLYYLEERNYLGGKVKAFMETNIQPIYHKLQNKGISWTDFGEALFYDRIASGDRSTQANPRGITPKAAEELIEKMKKGMSEDQWQLLQKSMDDFRDALKGVAEEAYKEGLYSPELHQKMMENPAYVTYRVLDYLEESVSSRVYKSIGTLKDISNPADSSLLKTFATMRAIERNKTTRAVVKFLQKNFKEDIKDAKTKFTGKGKSPTESKIPGEEMISYMENGKPVGFYVDKYIKTSVENDTIGDTLAVLKTLNSTLFRPLFITYNPGFQAFNLLRDFQRFWKNTPGMTLKKAVQLYRESVPVARARAWGIKTKAIEGGGELISQEELWGQKILSDMEYKQILSITYNQLHDSSDVLDTQIEMILRNSGLESFQKEERFKALAPFRKVLEFIKNMGDFIETLPKVAGYLELSEGGKAEISREHKSFIRKNIGSPDFLAGGYWKPITNEVFLFSNAITQGIRSDISVMTDPKTRSGYWYKTAKMNFLPKILMFLASLGAFGIGVKEAMDGASEYDKTNYTIIPLGTDENGKTIYFRVPQDEMGRLIAGLAWKLLNSTDNEQNVVKDFADIASFTGGQLPSPSPVITSGTATMQYLSGQNPYDWFRNREVLTDDQLKAGGMYSLKPFLGWLFNQSGGGVFYHFTQTPPKDQSGPEKFFNLPLVGNIAGRFVKVSNYGTTENLRQIKEEVQSEKARARLDENGIINDYIKEAQRAETDEAVEKIVAETKMELITEVLGHVPADKDELERAKNIVKKYTIGLKRGESDPYMNELITAQTNDEKAALLVEYREKLSRPQFNKLLLDAVKYKIISQDAIIKANSAKNEQ